MSEPLCSFCNQPEDKPLDKFIWSKDKLALHQQCRLYAEDIKRTTEFIKELLNNLERWSNNHPGWLYQSPF